ncbi:MAG: hypothetical protein ACR2NU_13645, partial [Aeoliella sp.]
LGVLIATSRGDYDGSGIVDQGDFITWKDSFGDTGNGLPADGNGDGAVNAADFSVWRNNLETAVTSNSAASGNTLAVSGSSSALVSTPLVSLEADPPAVDSAFVVVEPVENSNAKSLTASSVDAVFVDDSANLLLLADRLIEIEEDDRIDFELLDLAIKEEGEEEGDEQGLELELNLS